MKKILVLSVMALMFATVSALTGETKFQQYEQTTVKPIDVNRLNFGDYFALPFHYKPFTYSGFGIYYNPYFNNMVSDIGLNESEYPATTYVAGKEYTFNFSKFNNKKQN